MYRVYFESNHLALQRVTPYRAGGRLLCRVWAAGSLTALAGVMVFVFSSYCRRWLTWPAKIMSDSCSSYELMLRREPGVCISELNPNYPNS